MEKQRNHKSFRSVFGLLIFFLFSFSSSLFALSPEEIKKLKIEPLDNQTFDTDKDIKFQLQLPGINPLDVFISNPESEEKILFKTLRRTGYGKNNSGESEGTKIELWYQFTETGIFTPEPLELKIGTRAYRIPFSKIKISEKEENLVPYVYYIFSNGQTVTKTTSASLFQGTVSKPVNFQISIVNAREVKSIDYEIPKNSLFTKKSDISFEWTPMKKGRQKVPEIKVTVIANNGNKMEIKTPDCFITVQAATQSLSGGSTKADKTFADSFTDIFLDKGPEETETPQDSFEVKIKNRKKTVTKWLFISLFIILLAALVMYLLKIKSPVPYLILSVLLILAIILFTVLSKKHLAVYTEGTVKSIPELNSGKVLQIPENSEVKILKDVGGWYCIQNGSVTGWTLKENVRIY